VSDKQNRIFWNGLAFAASPMSSGKAETAIRLGRAGRACFPEIKPAGRYERDATKIVLGKDTGVRLHARNECRRDHVTGGDGAWIGQCPSRVAYITRSCAPDEGIVHLRVT